MREDVHFERTFTKFEIRIGHLKMQPNWPLTTRENDRSPKKFYLVLMEIKAFNFQIPLKIFESIETLIRPLLYSLITNECV